MCLPADVCATCGRGYFLPEMARECEIDHETDADDTNEHGMPDDRLDRGVTP